MPSSRPSRAHSSIRFVSFFFFFSRVHKQNLAWQPQRQCNQRRRRERERAPPCVRRGKGSCGGSESIRQTAGSVHQHDTRAPRHSTTAFLGIPFVVRRRPWLRCVVEQSKCVALRCVAFFCWLPPKRLLHTVVLYCSVLFCFIRLRPEPRRGRARQRSRRGRERPSRVPRGPSCRRVSPGAGSPVSVACWQPKPAACVIPAPPAPARRWSGCCFYCYC